MSSEKIVMHRSRGRPRSLSKKRAYKSSLEAKRRWRSRNKERISQYNQRYSNRSKRRSRKRSKSVTNKRKSGGSRKGSKLSITILKINDDGSKIVLIK